MKNASIICLLFIFSNIKAQKNNLEKVTLEFSHFKYPDTEYIIDYKKNELTCTMKISFNKVKDTTLFHKTYTFTSRKFKKLKKELDQDIPDSIIRKYESVLDGGGFIINYSKINGGISKLIIHNPDRKNPKYSKEFKKIDTFFDFVYSVVKDTSGVNTLDLTYRPYFSGLPIRKISESPLEYRIWGSISGSATWKNDLIPFIESLPKNKCVIIDCNNLLSYAWQTDILKLYITKNSNISFVNNDYLKYTRNEILKVLEKLKNTNNREEIDELKSTSIYNLYTSDIKGMNIWLESQEKSIEEYRKNCR